MSEPATRYEDAAPVSGSVGHDDPANCASPTVETVGTYTKPVLKLGSENPSSKLGGNACCGNC